VGKIQRHLSPSGARRRRRAPHAVHRGLTTKSGRRETVDELARHIENASTFVPLNRLAVSHAGQEKRNLGVIVLENGRFAMGRRLKPVLEAGRDAGLLKFDDCEAAFRSFFGLVVRDVQIRLLLGDALRLDEKTILADARRAREQFFALYGA
jgi:hypothetical protein